jgi:hypothetical protein
MDKMDSLIKYAESIKNKMADQVPSKQKLRQASYRQFLERELDAVNKKLSQMKLDTPVKTK